jgi:hypothetical protein
MKVRTALILAAFQLVAALLASAGMKLGYWDQDMTVRITMVAIGVMLLFSANFASKTVAPSAQFIAVHRFLGWSMAVGALVWTGAWLFAPMDVAQIVAPVAVVLGLIAGVANGFRVRPRITS